MDSEKAQDELQQSAEEFLDEATGSAWMFYHYYNPELLDAMQQVLVGHKIEDVVNGLLEGAYAERVKLAMEKHYKKFPGKRPSTEVLGKAK